MPSISKAQQNQEAKKASKLSNAIKETNFSKIEIDASEKAVFKSGTGEYVEFYPIAFTNLKTGEYAQGLKIVTQYDLEGMGATLLGGLGGDKGGSKSWTETAYLDINEVEQLIEFFDKYVLPNTDSDLERKNYVTYKFKSEEVVINLKVERDGNKTVEIFEVLFANRPYLDRYFWTKSQVKNTAQVVKTLKYITAKAKTKGGTE
ncbi:hypothetical protein [Hugenholtzia roseola]|uniref:hypothetical protein n=1 Tax=Hugenholtzia roseola TaxID=1002 RepID=UPI0012B6729D|nr:hypothetical protein [Hugenholtzia roseola]